MISALHDLEPDIRDLTKMALLAEEQIFRAIGELKCNEAGQYIEVPDMKTASLAVLVVEKLHDAAKELEAKFDHVFKQAIQATLS
jgi:hypothetical protein